MLQALPCRIPVTSVTMMRVQPCSLSICPLTFATGSVALRLVHEGQPGIAILCYRRSMIQTSFTALVLPSPHSERVLSFLVRWSANG